VVGRRFRNVGHFGFIGFCGACCRGGRREALGSARCREAGEESYSRKSGETGKGDGDTGKIIKKKPANFTDEKLMSAETDGSIFWKMGEGRGPMPSWKDELSDKERWQLVIFIRKLGKDAAASNPPASKDK